MVRLLASVIQQLNLSNFSTRSVLSINLIGRNVLKPKDLSTDEIKSLLWTAFDLKKLSCEKSTEINNVKSSRITLLMHEPCVEIQGSAHSATNFLQADLNIITAPLWESTEFVNDTACFLSKCSNIVFCQSQYQSKIEEFALGSRIPVVALKSCSFSILNTLADMLTLLMHYGYLEGLNVCWIGKPCPLINTYLCIATRLGLNIQYCCACTSGALMSPAMLPVGKLESERLKTILKECQDPIAALKGAHVIIVSTHPIKQYTVTLDIISEKCDKNWSLLHTLPRGTAEISQEVFEHKNSLVWKAKGNLQWVYAATMLRFLSHYDHVNKMIRFAKPKPTSQ